MRPRTSLSHWRWAILLALVLGVGAELGGAQQPSPPHGSDRSAAEAGSDATTGSPSGTLQAPARPTSGLVEWFLKGGLFMWPLLVASVVGLAAILERSFALHRAGTDTRRFIGRVVQELRERGLPAALEACRRTRGPVAVIIQMGLSKAEQGPAAVEKAIEAAGGIEVSFLQRGLIVLASVANIAPLLGFLGTVSGMIHAFEAIAATNQVTAQLVASGISEALITTEAGLCIAIPVQMFHNYFVSRIDRFVVEIEESSLDLLNEIETGTYKRS